MWAARVFSACHVEGCCSAAEQASGCACHAVHRYEDAIVALKAKVKETEGEDMREAIQDKVCAEGCSGRGMSTSGGGLVVHLVAA